MSDVGGADSGWRKSSWSGETTGCVEIRFAVDRVLVRHSRRRTDAALGFTVPEWHAFLAGVRSGDFAADAPGAAH